MADHVRREGVARGKPGGMLGERGYSFVSLREKERSVRNQLRPGLRRRERARFARRGWRRSRPTP